MKLGEGWLGAVCVALATSACGGVSDFEGLWAARSSEGTSSCYGDYENDEPDFTIRLRAGEDADLEYVSLAPDDLTEETCVQDFSVDGDVATIEKNQDCTFEYEGVDPDSSLTTTFVLRVSFLEDRLELDGDRLREEGESVSVADDGVECQEEFRLEFERVGD